MMMTPAEIERVVKAAARSYISRATDNQTVSTSIRAALVAGLRELAIVLRPDEPYTAGNLIFAANQIEAGK